MPRLLDGVDASRLRAGVSVQVAIEALLLVGSGLERARAAARDARRLYRSK